MIQAAGDYLKRLEDERTATEAARLAIHANDPDLITEVPFEVPPRQELPGRPQQPVITEMPKFDQHQ